MCRIWKLSKTWRGGGGCFQSQTDVGFGGVAHTRSRASRLKTAARIKTAANRLARARSVFSSRVFSLFVFVFFCRRDVLMDSGTHAPAYIQRTLIFFFFHPPSRLYDRAR